MLPTKILKNIETIFLMLIQNDYELRLNHQKKKRHKQPMQIKTEIVS